MAMVISFYNFQLFYSVLIGNGFKESNENGIHS